MICSENLMAPPLPGFPRGLSPTPKKIQRQGASVSWRIGIMKEFQTRDWRRMRDDVGDGMVLDFLIADVHWGVYLAEDH
jgi:hypothetical protein